MKKYLSLLLSLVILALLSSCGTSRKMTARPHSHSGKSTSAHSVKRQVITDFTIDPSLPTPAMQLLSEARTWLGVPYQWGGNDRQGVDCSGFVSQVFDKALNIKLPRTSVTQNEFCTDISQTVLEPGDLVFFDTSGDKVGEVSHVGLYIGNGNMIHASVTRGVTVSPIDGVYFGERFLNGGRVEAFYAMERAAKLPSPMPSAEPLTETPVEVAHAEPAAPQVQAPIIAPSAAVPAVQPPIAAAPRVAATSAPSDPRAFVLDMLVEQKLDSIYSHQ